MTREDAREILVTGGTIYHESWTFTKTSVSCEVGCCDETFSDIEVTLDHMERQGMFDDTQS